MYWSSCGIWYNTKYIVLTHSHTYFHVRIYVIYSMSYVDNMNLNIPILRDSDIDELSRTWWCSMSVYYFYFYFMMSASQFASATDIQAFSFDSHKHKHSKYTHITWYIYIASNMSKYHYYCYECAHYIIMIIMMILISYLATVCCIRIWMMIIMEIYEVYRPYTIRIYINDNSMQTTAWSNIVLYHHNNHNNTSIFDLA